jgi:hypothetical protein
MTPYLTQEQQYALDADGGAPLCVIDPRTNAVYVLIPKARYEQIKPLFEGDNDLIDTYAAQMESARRAGWDDPVMDDYNNYDENRTKQCP